MRTPHRPNLRDDYYPVVATMSLIALTATELSACDLIESTAFDVPDNRSCTLTLANKKTYWIITPRGCDLLVGIIKGDTHREHLRQLAALGVDYIPDSTLPGHVMEDLRMFGYIEEV